MKANLTTSELRAQYEAAVRKAEIASEGKYSDANATGLWAYAAELRAALRWRESVRGTAGARARRCVR